MKNVKSGVRTKVVDVIRVGDEARGGHDLLKYHLNILEMNAGKIC
jgi:hypothetical protein